jgi:hypothetical protein
MTANDEGPQGLLGRLRTDGPSEPLPVTGRRVMMESLRLLRRFAVWSAAAVLAALVGYWGWGATGAWVSAAAVVGLKLCPP